MAEDYFPEATVDQMKLMQMGTNLWAGDERLLVTFERKAVKDDVASKAEGTLKFKEVDYISIMSPGDRDQRLIVPVTPLYARRFAAKYEAWKKGKEDTAVNGMPLEQWPNLTKARYEELRYHGVRTVEQLALMTDAGMKKAHILDEERKAAQNWVKAQVDAKHVNKMQAELEKRDKDISDLNSVLQQTIEEMKALREQVQTK